MEFIKINQELINNNIEKIFKKLNTDNELVYSMLYSSIGGKTLRASLLLETIKGFSLEIDENIINLASAIEILHSYSLVHDDLPAMDNDLIRRHKASCHVKFGEDHAILTGDSLYSYTIELILKTNYNNDLKIEILKLFSNASGINGMILGQFLDIKSRVNSFADLKRLHLLKTGKMLELPILLALTILNKDKNVKNDFIDYAKNISLAFQAKDDLLDVLGDIDKLGKTPNKDEKLNKKTYVDFLGIEGTKKEIDKLIKNATASISKYNIKNLETIAMFIKDRDY